MSYPRHLLMTTPKGFRIAYAINPHMRNPDGSLKQVDADRAFAQWENLKALYVTLGLSVETIEGQDEFPDLVFSANPTFPFLTRDARPGVILGRMHSEFRRGESEIYAKWAKDRGLAVHRIENRTFEGSGDAIWNFETKEIFGGHGFRTDALVYDEVERVTGSKVHRLELVDERFYHLDTCLVILNAKTAAYVPEAFSLQACSTLQRTFTDLIAISTDEAIRGFAGNAFCPDGRNVLVQAGNTRFTGDLRERGFRVHEVETGEFIKSGGSVFCVKQQFWGNR